MNYRVFVDNSNVWIEGKFASAVHIGMANSIKEAHNNKMENLAWKMDFGKLLYIVTDGEPERISEAVLYGSKPPQNDTLWDAARRCGFEVQPIERNYFNKEKRVDTEIVARIVKTVCKNATTEDHFVLVMGDADFMPAIEAIHEEGLKVTVAFWGNAATELKSSADTFINLDDKIESFTLI